MPSTRERLFGRFAGEVRPALMVALSMTWLHAYRPRDWFCFIGVEVALLGKEELVLADIRNTREAY